MPTWVPLVVCCQGQVLGFAMRRKFAAGLVAALLFVAGCTSDDEAADFGCVSADERERHSASSFPLSVSQNPVSPGATIDLNIGSTLSQSSGGSDAGDELSSLTGYGSTWQCWTGSQWVGTHLLVHNGDSLAGEPGATTTAPAIGLLVPNTFSIVIPQVDPGWYRIEVGISVDQPDGPPDQIVGHVAIEVTESG